MRDRIILAVKGGSLIKFSEVPSVKGTVNALKCEFRFLSTEYDSTYRILEWR